MPAAAVTTLGELEVALRAALAAEGPYLIECLYKV